VESYGNQAFSVPFPMKESNSIMVQSRRLGVEGSKQRVVLMDAAEAILCGQGYVGISARNVALKAGLTKQNLYYYFRTMDDLILALVQRVNERRQKRFEEALASAEPLKTLWALNSDRSGAALATELTAIANHRDAVRTEIVTAARRFREQQVRALSELLAAHDTAYPSAAGLVMIAAAVAKTVTSESALGLTEGHAEAQEIVEAIIAELSVPRP
jgi:AcrR family transcriptional regulator